MSHQMAICFMLPMATWNDMRSGKLLYIIAQCTALIGHW